jgi:hypothetical protein
MPLTIAHIVHVTVLATKTVVVIVYKWWHFVVVVIKGGQVSQTVITEHIAHHGGRMRLRGTHSISRRVQ